MRKIPEEGACFLLWRESQLHAKREVVWAAERSGSRGGCRDCWRMLFCCQLHGSGEGILGSCRWFLAGGGAFVWLFWVSRSVWEGGRWMWAAGNGGALEENREQAKRGEILEVYPLAWGCRLVLRVENERRSERVWAESKPYYLRLRTQVWPWWAFSLCISWFSSLHIIDLKHGLMGFCYYVHSTLFFIWFLCFLSQMTGIWFSFFEHDVWLNTQTLTARPTSR